MTDSPLRQHGSTVMRFIARAEEIILCLLLLAIIGLACLQIVLRSVFDSSLLWADPLIRYLVLWTGLLGGVMATSRGKHIALDVASFLIPKRLRPWVWLLIQLFAAVVAAFLTWAALLFIRNEAEYGGPGLFGVPTWGWNLVFPLAFGLITLHYLVLLLTTVSRIFRHHSAPPAGTRQP